jgi:PqqD family protein of HPr-rel-A system
MTALAKQAGRFTETAIDEEIVVMHLGSGEFFSLAGTAAATWRLIDGTRDREALIDALASQFGGDEREIAQDVDEFVLQLRELGLVHDD